MARLEVVLVWWCSTTLLIGSAALQARAVGLLLADSLLPIRARDVVASRGGPRSPPDEPPEPATDPFALASSLSGADNPEPFVEPPSDVDPFEAEPCPDVRVTIVTEASSSEGSVAELRGPGEPQASSRRVGDRVGSLSVVHIGFNARRESPAVWLRGDVGLCQVTLFQMRARPPAPRVAERPRAKLSAVGEAIRQKVERVGEGRFRIQRSLLDDVLAEPTSLGGVRLYPVLRDNRTLGLRLKGVPQDGLLHRLGLRSGDRLVSMNETPLTGSQSALQAYTLLRTARAVSLELERNGHRELIQVELY